MAEHLLHAAQVGAALEQVRRERVAQEVRVHPLMVRSERREARRELPSGVVVRLVDGDRDDLALMQAVQAVAF